MEEVILVASRNHPLAADFVSHVAREGRCKVAALSSVHHLGQVETVPVDGSSGIPSLAAGGRERWVGVVIFLDRNRDGRQEAWIQAVASFVRENRIGSVCIVSSF